MPIIKVWCLPLSQTEEDLRRLHQAIVREVTAIEELGLQTENDITCLFPPDQMTYGLGSEVIVEISGLFKKPERTRKVIQRLANNVGSAVSALYPEAKTECLVYSFDPAQGFWTSADPDARPVAPPLDLADKEVVLAASLRDFFVVEEGSRNQLGGKIGRLEKEGLRTVQDLLEKTYVSDLLNAIYVRAEHSCYGRDVRVEKINYRTLFHLRTRLQQAGLDLPVE